MTGHLIWGRIAHGAPILASLLLVLLGLSVALAVTAQATTERTQAELGCDSCCVRWGREPYAGRQQRRPFEAPGCYCAEDGIGLVVALKPCQEVRP
jgi:hypothetical protein